MQKIENTHLFMLHTMTFNNRSFYVYEWKFPLCLESLIFNLFIYEKHFTHIGILFNSCNVGAKTIFIKLFHPYEGMTRTDQIYSIRLKI